MPHAQPPSAGRRSLLAVLICLVLSVALQAWSAVAPPKPAGPPSLEERLGTIAQSLYAAAERRILAPARREAGAVYRRVADELRPAAERLSSAAGNARRTLAEWFGRQLARPATSKPAGPAIATAALPQPDLLRNMKGEDPFEPVNRIVFDMNANLRLAVFDPVAGFYLAHTTSAVQARVRNFFANLHEPVTVVASALEGRFADAGTAAARFGINTTLGVGGLFDPAARFGLTVEKRNLEQALCLSGLPAGPYLVLPILGPATVRDAAGRLATLVAYFEVMGVYVYVPYRLSDLALQYADHRDRISFLDSLSRDPYVAQRALYLTARNMACGDQAALDRQFLTK